MGKLIKCHFCYLFNKVTLLMFVFTIIVVTFFSFITIINLDNRVQTNEGLMTYYFNSYQIVKYITAIISICLFGFSFHTNNDQYRVILLSKKVRRSSYLISKFLTILIIIFYLYTILLIIIITIGISFGVFFSNTIIIAFIDIFIIDIYFGCLSLIIILLFDNIYLVISLLPFIFINSSNDSSIDDIIKYILPICDENNIFHLPILYYILIIILLVFIIIIIYSKRDL